MVFANVPGLEDVFGEDGDIDVGPLKTWLEQKPEWYGCATGSDWSTLCN